MERLTIGQIRSPHGVEGYLKAESYSGEVDHFLRLKGVDLVSGAKVRHFEVEAARLAGRFVLLKLSGIESPEAGKQFSSWEISVDRGNAAGLGDGEYYYADLCNCAVVKGDKELGRVRTVCEGAGADLLEVETPLGKRYLVPFIDQFVGAVDMTNRTVELKADWLLQ